MALADTAELAIRINLTGNASTGINKLNRQVSGLGKSIGRAGKGVGQIGAGFARAGLVVGGAAVAGLGAAAKAAIDFEDAFAGVRKTVNESDLKAVGLSFESLAIDFRKMATEIPIAATEFARIGETAGALGVKAKDIKEFTRVTALMGVTTNLTADDAADAFGRIGTILNLSGKDFSELADTIVNLGNQGASTESEITEIIKRFAAEANAAGLAKEEIAGLASATASLGFQPERGGTALARVFANMATNISLANSKGKAFSKLTGRSIKNLQKDINRGKGLDIFLDVLGEIKDLSPTEAARTLKALGVTNTSDRTIFRAMADQLPFINGQLKIAETSTGALGKEAQKRFDTVRSKIQLLKNNLIEAGIVLGEGFAPAIGRAAEKLSAFLKQDGNRSELKKLGEDIGKSIDAIDWNEVLTKAKELVGIMRGALTVAKAMFDAFNALPGPIKEATAGFLVLNKLSGGLLGSGVGNVAGGIAETVIRGLGSKLPGGAGKLFAQPVFVTNWPPGMGVGGGVPGAAAGGAAAVPAALAIGAGALVGAAKQGAATEFSTALRNSGIKNSLDKTEGSFTIFGNSLGTLAESIRLLGTSGALQPPGPAHGGKSPDQRQEESETAQRVKDLALQEQRRGERTVQSVDQTKAAIQASKDRLVAANAETKRETTRGVNQTKATGAAIQNTTRSATLTGAQIGASATHSAAGAIVGAIWAARPIVNVTQVTRTTTIQQRYGPSAGSSGNDSGNRDQWW